jgi:hypothetical protein
METLDSLLLEVSPDQRRAILASLTNGGAE